MAARALLTTLRTQVGVSGSSDRHTVMHVWHAAVQNSGVPIIVTGGCSTHGVMPSGVLMRRCYGARATDMAYRTRWDWALERVWSEFGLTRSTFRRFAGQRVTMARMELKDPFGKHVAADMR
jgi:hypothetical protein